jgi:hypothetical protein
MSERVLDDFRDGLVSMSNGALMALLRRVEEEEELISQRRRRLHGRIDNIGANGGGLPELDDVLLPFLQEEERGLSEQRLLLHQRITEIRSERGRRAAGLRDPLNVAG